MRRAGAGGMAAALVVGLVAAVAAAGGPDGDSRTAPGSKSLLGGLFADKPKAKPKAEKKTPEVHDRPAAPTTVDRDAFEQKWQMNAYLRRVQVCDRLRQIAEQNNDQDLLRKIDQLESRAWEVYRQHTAGMPAAPEPAVDRPAPTKPSGEGGEKVEDGGGRPREPSGARGGPGRGSLEEEAGPGVIRREERP